MLCAAWPHVRSDLASTRRDAAAFLGNLEGVYGAKSRQSWVQRWTDIADAHCLVGDLDVEKGAFDEAAEAWLCALTAFEVARRLVDEDDPQSGNVSAKVEAGIQRFGSLERKVERVQLACDDTAEFLAYYLPAGRSHLPTPAVVCISSEEETGVTLLGRLLPVVVGRGISVLAVSHDDLSNHWRDQANFLLSCCLDYLSGRPDVDAARIGVSGEGLSAVLATDFVLSDRRVAAAVCDAGLWNWARTLASVAWIARTADEIDEAVPSAHRSRLVRQMKCPVLVVAGGRGIVSATEAIKLQAECEVARIDLELAMPQMARTPVGDIENFVTSDDCIFGWLEHKLARSSVR
ncbi:hypothetical protein LMTR3_21315 [Bradyrhizobium sp. LMTR 3]|nr:hypothetical protein LMTR3_21315 [Bradyrhizobium sp. LMTR 3]